jgi:hypothetical protein
MQLALDPVDELADIFLITTGEGHRSHGVLNGHEGLVYVFELLAIHETGI